MATQGRSLELYFTDGKADGLVTAEVFGWTGRLLKAPRTQLAAAMAHNEADRPNDTIEWKVNGTSKTYREWEALQLAKPGVGET